MNWRSELWGAFKESLRVSIPLGFAVLMMDLVVSPDKPHTYQWNGGEWLWFLGLWIVGVFLYGFFTHFWAALRGWHD